MKIKATVGLQHRAENFSYKLHRQKKKFSEKKEVNQEKRVTDTEVGF